METFGIMGFIFGLIALSTAMTSSNKVKELEKRIDDLEGKSWTIATTYKFVEDSSASELHYQIDYRSFNKKSDYVEYKELFAESGWTILSKSRFYSKHIFISTTKNKIFSDNVSLVERDINRYRVAKLYAVFFVIQAIIAAALYFHFDYAYFGAATLFGIVAAIYNGIDARKRRKKIPSVSLG